MSLALTAAASMRRSPALKGRIEAAAEEMGPGWADSNIGKMCRLADWVKAWTDAAVKNPFESDLGLRIDVITDDMIEKAVADLADASADTPAAPGGNAFALLQVQVQQQAAQMEQQAVLLQQQAAEIAALRAQGDATSEAPATEDQA